MGEMVTMGRGSKAKLKMASESQVLQLEELYAQGRLSREIYLELQPFSRLTSSKANAVIQRAIKEPPKRTLAAENLRSVCGKPKKREMVADGAATKEGAGKAPGAKTSPAAKPPAPMTPATRTVKREGYDPFAKSKKKRGKAGSYEQNKRQVLSGATYRSQKPSNYRLGKGPGSHGG